MEAIICRVTSVTLYQYMGHYVTEEQIFNNSAVRISDILVLEHVDGADSFRGVAVRSRRNFCC